MNDAILSLTIRQKIDRERIKFPPEQKQSAVIASLAIAQEEFGWLSPQTQKAVAEYLEMPAIAVQEVASFYTMFRTEPVGKYTLTLCTNLPCQLMGSEAAAAQLKKTLGIDYRQTTADGCFTLLEGECMGACGDAPVVLVNNRRMCSRLSCEKIDALVHALRSGEEMP